MEEEVAIAVIAAAVEVEDATPTDDTRLPETETAAATDSVSLHCDVTLTLTCHLVIGAADPLGLPSAPVLHRQPQIYRPHLAESATNHTTDDANAPASQYLPSDAAAEEREGAAVRITVTVLKQDPFPAAVPRAHVPPEETAAEAPSLAAAVYPATPGAPSLYLARDPAAHLDVMPAAIPVA